MRVNVPIEMLIRLTELSRRHSHLAVEVATKGGLLVEAQHVGNGLHGEVAPYMQEHLGLRHNPRMYPVGGSVPSFLLDDGAEMLGRKAGFRCVESHIAMLTEMLGEVGMELGADPFVDIGFIQFACPILAEQPQKKFQQSKHQHSAIRYFDAHNLAHTFHDIHNHLVFMSVKFHARMWLVAVAQLLDDLQHRVAEHRGLNNNQRGKVVVGLAHRRQGVVGKDDTHGMLLGKVGIVIVHEIDTSSMSDTNDIIGRNERLFAGGQTSHIIEHNDAFLFDSLIVKSDRMGI